MDLPPVAVRNEDGFFSCVKCSKKFSSKSATVRHYRNHTGEHPYVCSLCQAMFTSKSNLSTHELRAHNLNREFALSCAECGKLFMRRFSLEVHLKIHNSQKSFSCDHCGKSFTQKVTRDIHMAKHTGEYKYECAACFKTFASRAKLNSHSVVHQPARFTCERCGRRFVRHDSLRVHLRTHLRTAPRAATAVQQPFQCCRCSLVLSTRSELQLHKQTHKEVMSCECMWCNADLEGAVVEGGIKDGLLENTSYCKAFEGKMSSPSDETSVNSNSCLISNTLLAKLENQKPLSAEDLISQQRCVTLPPSTANQEKKTVEIAGKERIYTCHICPKSFAYKNKLSAHVKTHLQEPSHECDICCKRFYRKDVCARHRLLHRNQRPFLCAHCGKSFITKFSLSAHLKTHSSSKDRSLRPEFQCEGCGKKFKHKSTFNLHRRAHAGDVQHECLMCGKKFMKRSHLEGHVRSHCADRPFRCASCGRRFKERKHCREHTQKAHADAHARPLASLLERSAAAVSSSSASSNSSSQQSPSHLLNGANLLNAVAIEENMVSRLQVPEIPQELPSALICNAMEENNSSALDATYLISSPVHLSETSIVMTTPITSLVLSNLEPILQENRIPEVNQFLSADGQSDLDETNIFHLGSQNDSLTFSVLSDGETQSVLSQGME